MNTLPGTLYHHLWKESGIELPELITKLVGYAEEKYEKKKEYTHIFKSDILKYANSVKMQLKGGK